MNEAQQHSLILVAVFSTTALALFVYRHIKPEHRPETLRLAIFNSVLCALAFSANTWLTGQQISDGRLQALAVAPVNFALIMMIAAICTIQARSLGTVDISPKARQFLRHTPQVFLLCFAANVATGLLWPMPVLKRFDPAPPLYLLNRAFVTVPETLFLFVAAFVSFQAAGSQEPVPRIRVQHAAFCGAQLMLVCTALNTYSVVVARVFITDDALRRSLIDSALARESWLAVTAAALYVIGFALYYEPDERARRITRFSKWRRYRRALDQRLWAFERTADPGFLEIYDRIPDAARELARRAEADGKTGEFLPDDTTKALDAFRLLALVHTGGPTQQEHLGRLIRYQEGLLRDQETRRAGWAVATTPARVRAYNMAEDPVHEPLKRVWELLKSPADPSLVAHPQWLQLAVVAAADAGLLPYAKSHVVVMDRVLTAYNNACLAAELLHASQPSAASDTSGPAAAGSSAVHTQY